MYYSGVNLLTCSNSACSREVACQTYVRTLELPKYLQEYVHPSTQVVLGTGR